MSVDTGTTAVVALDQIEVDPAENPRGEIDVRTLGELIASIEQHGVLQPVLVEPDNGHYKLVAGYRRLLSAAAAELEEIPVLIRDANGNRATFALSENLPGLRENMDPVAEARAIERIGNAESLNQKKLAKKLGKSEAFVRDRLRLIRLPEAVQDAIAAGDVPVSAAPELEQIAKVSEELAAFVTGAVRRDDVEAAVLIESPGQAISQALGEALERDEGLTPGALPALALGYGSRVDLGVDLAEGEARDALIERYQQLGIEDYYEGYGVRLREEDLDALRALGVMLEFEHGFSHYRFACDQAALVDRIGLVLDEAEKELAKRERARKREEAAERKRAAKAAGVDPSEVDPEELARAERKAEREEREAEKRQARSNNEELGHRLVRRRGRNVSAKRQRERARAVAHLVVEDNAAALGAALRLVREDWKEVEVPTRKDGSPGREKVTYLAPAEAVERLLRDIDQAKDATGVIETLVEALVAATYASEDELVQSQRTFKLHLRADNAFGELIDAEAKSVLPEALEAVAKRRADIRAL